MLSTKYAYVIWQQNFFDKHDLNEEQWEFSPENKCDETRK